MAKILTSHPHEFREVSILESDAPGVSTTIAPAANFFSLGADLLGEVQRIIGSDHVKSLRIKVGDRVVKEIQVQPLKTAATIAIVLLAVVISTLSIDIDHEPSGSEA